MSFQGCKRIITRYRFLLSFAAGCLLALGLPPVGFWPVIYLGFPLLLHMVRHSDPFNLPNYKHHFLIGLAFAFGYFLFGLYWIGVSFSVYNNTLTFLAPPAVAGLCLLLSLPYGGVLVAVQWANQRYGLAGAALTLVLGWNLADHIRGDWGLGFPWNSIGHLWADNLILSQQASWWGASGMGIAVISAALTPYILFHLKQYAGRSLHFRFRLAAIGLLLPVVLFTLGALRLSQAPPLTEYGPPIIRLVQANIPQSEKWKSEKLIPNLEKYRRMSAQDLPETIRDIVWTEMAMPFVGASNPELLAYAASILPPGGRLITGTQGVNRLNGEIQSLYNQLITLDNQGRILSSYNKHKLVPFGEYIPFSGILSHLGLRKLTVGALDFEPGQGPMLIKDKGFPSFSPLICYEVIFPKATLVNEQKEKPQLLINITNDAWFGRTSGPYQHLAQARLRSIEQGIPLVRVAGTGISIGFDGYGRSLGQIPLESMGVLDLPLPPALNSTFYERYLNLFSG